VVGPNNDVLLDRLNNDPQLDATGILNNFLHEDENINHFFVTRLESKYFDSESFISTFAKKSKPIIISLNIQSLNSKFLELKCFIDNLVNSGIAIDMIILQETWQINFSDLLALPNYQPLILKNRNNMRGGGVGVYIKKGINFKIRNDLEKFQIKTFENIVVELFYPNKSVIISNIYRSPNPPTNSSIAEHRDNFLEILDSHLNDLCELNKETFIFLDANINLLKLNEVDFPNDYMNVCIGNGFIQLICKATRVQGEHFSLIDHILTNSNQNSYCTGTLLSDISDHFINFLQLPDDKVFTKKQSTLRRIFSKNSILNFKRDLSNLNWNETILCNDVNLAFSYFWKTFNDMFNLHFPLKRFKFNRNLHKINNFMTNGLLISRKTKIELLKKATVEKSKDSFNRYRKYRNIFNSLIRLSKKLYFNDGFSKHVKNPKKTWDLLKEAANLSNNNKSGVEKLVIDNTVYNEPNVIADKFNEFFAKIGPEIAKSVNPTTAKPEDFLPIYEDLFPLEFYNITPNVVNDIIKSMQTKNSMDADGLSTKLLKEIKNEISFPLAHIFNLSVQKGVFPEGLKTSRTVPIFKSGDPFLMDNYRPISLLSQLSKILEKIVSNQLVNHLDRNNILYEHQYGFQKNKSTEHNLVQALNFISKSLNENKFCIGVFFDLRKAFDVCSYEVSIMKLAKIGIHGVELEWFKSYLSARKQFVDINGSCSSEIDILTVILQGSILGPILFLIYINDLFRVSRSLTLMFADDTFALKADSNLENLITNINSDIKMMAMWFKANKLAVNISKTKYIIFRNKGKVIGPNLPPVLYDENEPNQPHSPDKITVLERLHEKHENSNSRAYKLLGIYLDEYLSFDYHANYLLSKLNRSMFCIKMAKNNVNYKGRRSLYFALVHSHLNYCPTILSCLTQKNKNKLFKVQKKALRIMTGSNYNAHTAPLFIQHKILPFEKLLKFGNLSFMHSINYKYAPKSFDQTWLKNDEVRGDLNLRNNCLFSIPAPRTESFKRFPLYSLPNEWNKSGNLMFYANTFTFKLNLREQLFAELISDSI